VNGGTGRSARRRGARQPSLTGKHVARLITAEVEESIDSLGGRLAGAGLEVTGIRVAVGQPKGIDTQHQPFLLGRPGLISTGWAVEVALSAGPSEGRRPHGVTMPRTPVSPLGVLGPLPLTALRGVDMRVSTSLRNQGVTTVAALAEVSQDDLAALAVGPLRTRCLDAWSRALLLGVPLQVVPGDFLPDVTLAAVAGLSPAQLRRMGTSDDVPEQILESLCHGLALLGAALDLRVLRQIRLRELVRPVRTGNQGSKRDPADDTGVNR
jgi:hypothetical protein